MRYLVLISLILAIWAMLEEYIFKDRRSEGLEGFWDKVRDFGSHFHKVIGIVAALILVVYFLRLLWYAFRAS